MAFSEVRANLKGQIFLQRLVRMYPLGQKGLSEIALIPHVSFSKLKQGKPVSVKVAVDIFEALASIDTFDSIDFENYEKYLEQYSENTAVRIPDELAHRRSNTEGHIEDSIRDFVGRAYVYDQLDKFITTHRSGYFCLVGYPGDGKTAIAGNYVRQVNDQALYHFVRKGEYGGKDITFFLENICHHLLTFAAQFGCTLSPPYDGAWLDGEYLNVLLKEISDTLLQPQQKKLVVVVDALDEVTEQPRDTEENLLCLPKKLPANIYFMVTQRPAALQRGKKLHPETLKDTPAKVFDLRTEWNRRTEKGEKSQVRLDIENNINEYIDKFLAGEVKELYSEEALGQMLVKRLTTVAKEHDYSEMAFRERLTDISVGNFMYIVYVLPDIAKGLYPVDLNKKNITQLPSGLEDYYSSHIKRLNLSSAQWLTIYVIALFTRPRSVRRPSVPLIAEGANQPEKLVRQLVRTCAKYLEESYYEDSVEPGYWVYHQSFRDWLEETLDVEELTGMTKAQIERLIDENGYSL